MPATQPRKPQDYKKAKPKSVSSAADFKKNRNSALELPSGNSVKARRVPITELLSGDDMPDSLTEIVQTMLNQQDGKNVAEEADKAKANILNDASKIADMMDLFDRVAARIVVEPETVYYREQDEDGVWHEIPDEDRDEELLYTDEISFEDKNFLFQWSVGGETSVAAFRTQAGAAVGSVETS